MFRYYESVSCSGRFLQSFGVRSEAQKVSAVYPGDYATFLRLPSATKTAGLNLAREALRGRFGLRPYRVRHDGDDLLSTFQAPAEQLEQDRLIHEAWLLQRHCLIPVESLVMADWRTGQESLVRIRHRDQRPMALGGLWMSELSGDRFDYSFAMLSLIAKPDNGLPYTPGPDSDRRLPMIVPEEAYDAWMDASTEVALGYLKQPYPFERLQVEPLLD